METTQPALWEADLYSVYVTSWTVDLYVGVIPTRYVIKVERRPYCYGQQVDIFVNEQRIHDHSYDCFACCLRTFHEWELGGHDFHLTINPFRLFVDGFDVDTGKKITDFEQSRRKIISLIIWFTLLIFTVASLFYLVKKDTLMPSPLLIDVVFKIIFIFLVLEFGAILLRIYKVESRKHYSPSKLTGYYKSVMTV